MKKDDRVQLEFTLGSGKHKQYTGTITEEYGDDIRVFVQWDDTPMKQATLEYINDLIVIAN